MPAAAPRTLPPLKPRKNDWWHGALLRAMATGETFNDFCRRTRKSARAVGRAEDRHGLKLKRARER